MEKIRLYEILDSLSRNERLSVSKEEYSELIDLLAQDDSQQINSWLDIKKRASEFLDEPDKAILDEVFANLQKVINTEDTFTEGEKRKIVGNIFIKRFQQIAAILVIPLLLGLIYMTVFNERDSVENVVADNIVNLVPFNVTSIQEYYSPAGTRSKIVLKDSTVVYLNSATTLLVDNNFGDSLRRVKLSGEAYFSVRKDKDRPFIVDAGEKLKIRVTGTTFTVNAYPDKKDIETVLLTGAVELVTGKRIVPLDPNQRAIFDNDKKIVISSVVKTEKYEEWKDGVLVFDNTSMGEIKAILEKWYNVKIEIKDKEIMNYTFSGKLNNCSLQQVLEYITISSQMRFTINKDKVDINKK